MDRHAAENGQQLGTGVVMPNSCGVSMYFSEVFSFSHIKMELRALATADQSRALSLLLMRHPSAHHPFSTACSAAQMPVSLRRPRSARLMKAKRAKRRPPRRQKAPCKHVWALRCSDVCLSPRPFVWAYLRAPTCTRSVALRLQRRVRLQMTRTGTYICVFCVQSRVAA